MVDCHCKFQVEKCSEHGDMHAHLNKLQIMHEDLGSMGASIMDEDFTSIILGSILPLYDTYIAAITATSTLLNQVLTPTNLIDSIPDEADCRAIKNPKSKKDEHDTAFVAGQSKKGGGSGSKKLKKMMSALIATRRGIISETVGCQVAVLREKVRKIGRESRRKWQQRPK